MPGKIRVAVIFGGKSAEHEISLLSARNVVTAMDRGKYDVSLIGIDKEGRWHLHEEAHYLLNAEDPERIALSESSEEVTVVANGAAGALVNFRRPEARCPIDVAFPVLHGTFGEDGTVQGLLKLMDVPFVGPSVLGSSVCMDKDVAKRLLRDAGIPNSDFVVLRKGETLDIARIVERLGLPCFVKPANMGSSVGIHKAHDREELAAAIADAFLYDRKVLIEEYIQGRELECAVLGNEAPIASIAGEVIPKHEFYSYEAKYIDADGAALVIPAALDKALLRALQDMAVRAFRASSARAWRGSISSCAEKMNCSSTRSTPSPASRRSACIQNCGRPAASAIPKSSTA